MARSTLLKASTSSSCCLLPSTPWPKSSSSEAQASRAAPKVQARREQIANWQLKAAKALQKSAPTKHATKGPTGLLPDKSRQRAGDPVTARFCTDTFCHESSVCPHSVKVFRVQGRHERHHALFCPLFFASLYRSRRQANKHTHVPNGNGTTSRANDAKVSINLLATLNVGGFHNATKWLAIQQLSQQFIALTETQLTSIPPPRYHSTPVPRPHGFS